MGDKNATNGKKAVISVFLFIFALETRSLIVFNTAHEADESVKHDNKTSSKGFL